MGELAGLLLSNPAGGPGRLAAMAAASGVARGGVLFDERSGAGLAAPAGSLAAGGGRAVWAAVAGTPTNLADLGAELGAAEPAEVVARGYEAWGGAGLASRLRGDFAFAVWDAGARAAVLARDRSGAAPLFYVARAAGLAFGSRLRAVAKSGLCFAKLDEEALWAYMLTLHTPPDRTLLAGVRRLPAGHLLAWTADAGARVERFDLPEVEVREDRGLEEAAAALRDAAGRAVRAIGDAGSPAGCLLDGGPAAALVAAAAARSGRPVTTYAIAVPGDESRAREAERVAASIGATHHPVGFGPLDLAARIEAHAPGDEPVGDAAALGGLLLAEAAARDGAVVLSGAGGDELFAAHRYYDRALGAAPGDRAGRTARLRELRAALEARLGRPAHAPDAGTSSARAGFPHAAQPEFLYGLLGPGRRPPVDTFRRALAALEERAARALPESTPLRRATLLDLRLRLEPTLPARLGGRASAPLLDPDVVGLALSLPEPLLAGGAVLRRAAAEAARGGPSAAGGALPLDRWFREELAGLAREALLGSSFVREGVLAREGVEALLAAHGQLGVDLGGLVWALVAADRWWQSVRAEVAEPNLGRASALAGGEPTVDVVIPIYEGFSLVRDCVRSMRAFTGRPFRAILIDDAGSAATHERLRGLVAGDPRFELVRNERNLGFLRTCQRGLAMSDADYVVLLNSDTVVAPGWLERMVACAESDPTIAIVNPLTNESGNTSVRLAPGLSLLTMAARVAELSERRYPNLTTGVGMCMLVRRSALDLLGGFDEAFAPAYCEESDMCMRYTEAGLRVVAADDAFIYHKGWASYDAVRKNALYERNRRTFDERWAAAYERDWEAYARHDPLQYMRDALTRGTVSPGDARAARRRAIESQMAGVEPAEAVAAGSGAALAALIESRVRPVARRKYREYALGRHLSPPNRFDDRALLLPTRPYVRALPRPDPGRLRVTFLMSDLPLAGGVISVLQLAREFLLAGHDVCIATEGQEATPERHNLWLQPLVYRNREHLIDAFPDSDVVVATFWVTAHSYLPELHRRYEFVSTYLIQDYEAWFYPEHEFEHRRDVIRSYRAAEHRTVMSNWVGEMVGRHGTPCELVHLGLDVGVFYPRGNKPGSRLRVASPAYPGSDRDRRGFDETVEAFRRIHAARPEVEFVFFGADQAKMPELPFPYENAGRLYDQNKVAELVASAHVLTDLSHWQGFGRPGLEALGCATVPVLTNVGGLHDYARDGVNSLLVPPFDPGAAAAAVLRLADDPALLARLAAEGPPTAARFDHRDEAARHLELYARWVEEKFGAGGARRRGRRS